MPPYTLNKNQQVYTGGFYPISAYTRVVSVLVTANQGTGPTFQISPQFGQDFWLLNIRCWVTAKAIDPTRVTSVSFRYGIGVPANAAALMAWDEVLPLTGLGGARSNWLFYDGAESKSWEMSRRYTGQGQRLAVWAARSHASNDVVQVSFLIAEG